MSLGPRIAVPHPGIDAAEWATLLASRSDNGTVDANTVAHVFRNVELNADMIRHIESVLQEANISIVTVEPEISSPVERKLPPARKPITNGRSISADAGDAVRMYLQEIGQVDLLTADDERRLGRAIREMQQAKERL